MYKDLRKKIELELQEYHRLVNEEGASQKQPAAGQQRRWRGKPDDGRRTRTLWRSCENRQKRAFDNETDPERKD